MPTEREVKAALSRSLDKTAQRAFLLLALLFAVSALSRLLWFARTAGEIGTEGALAGGGGGSVLMVVLQAAFATVVARFTLRPALNVVYRRLLDGGCLVSGRISAEPEALSRRLGGAFRGLGVIERVIAAFVPTRISTFEFELDGRKHTRATALTFHDEAPYRGASGDVMILVDATAPTRHRWLYRIALSERRPSAS